MLDGAGDRAFGRDGVRRCGLLTVLLLRAVSWPRDLRAQQAGLPLIFKPKLAKMLAIAMPPQIVGRPTGLWSSTVPVAPSR